MNHDRMPTAAPAPRAAFALAALVLPWATGRTPAWAEPHCMARVLADVPALEASEQVKSKESGTFGPITAVKVEKSSGKMFYCATNTYCYGSNAFQITTPCRLKLDKSYGFGGYFVYSAR